MASISEDRILDFLDGRLASGDEEELLHTLAVSPERRQLLREHLRIREITTTLSGHERFSVPAHVTSGLFATLATMGFNAPASTETILTRAPQLVRSNAAERTMLAAKSAWRVGLTSIATASVVSFILGAGALYVFGSSLGIGALTGKSDLAANSNSQASTHPVRTQFSSVLARMTPSTPTVVYVNQPVAASTAGQQSIAVVPPVPVAAGPAYEPSIAITSDLRQHEYSIPSRTPQADR